MAPHNTLRFLHELSLSQPRNPTDLEYTVTGGPVYLLMEIITLKTLDFILLFITSP